MKKWIFFTAVCLSLILTVVLGGRTPALASSLEKKLYEAAKQEGSLEYWDSLSLKEIGNLWKGFESKYPGIKLKYYEATTDVREEKYLAEHNAGRHTADVVPIDLYHKFKEKGLLMDLSDIIKDTGYPKQFTSEDRDAAFMEHLLVGTVYNTNHISPQDAPRSWGDLLDPKWKGKINVETRMKYFIYATGSWGEEKIVDYLKKLSKQNPTFTKGNTYTMALLAAGEFPIAVGCYFHKTIEMQLKGAPVEWAQFSPIVDKLTPYVAMQHAPHPNAAKLFLHWWMSPEGSAYVDAKRYKGNPLPGAGTETSKFLEKKGSPELYTVPTWAVLDIKELEKKYMQAIGYSKAREVTKTKKKK